MNECNTGSQGQQLQAVMRKVDLLRLNAVGCELLLTAQKAEKYDASSSFSLHELAIKKTDTRKIIPGYREILRRAYIGVTEETLEMSLAVWLEE
jgi:hypothetical protein